MQAVDDVLPDAEFITPDPSAIDGRQVTVPALGGLPPSDAAAELQETGFVPTIGRFVDSTYPKGTVAYTSPVEGAGLGTGSPVTIYVSDGSPRKGSGDGE
jgi:beta-lactam-binding protein with PASTA domain